MEERCGIKMAMELREDGYPWEALTPNPTALEIIEQMPTGTRIQYDLSLWECWFPLAQMQEDYRYDECPHKACSLAYIACKKGDE